MKLEPRTKTLHEFSDAALSHSQFCYKDNSKVKDVDEEQHYVENVSPHLCVGVCLVLVRLPSGGGLC